MIKVEVIENFTLEDYNKLKNVKKVISRKENEFGARDTFECDEKMVDYLTGNNALNKVVVKVIEVEPEKEQWTVTKEEDGNVHVRPVVNGEIIDTPVEKIIKPKSNKNKKHSKK